MWQYDVKKELKELEERIDTSMRLHWGSLFIEIGLLVLILIALAGCSTVEHATGGAPYAEISQGWQIPGRTDFWRRPERDFNCSDGAPTELAVGLEWDRWRLEYNHQSNLTCGYPFNDRPETYQEKVQISYKWGGR